jgi:hypothetical protein
VNKASRPVNWKSSKSTWRCAGPIESETWQPGTVISKNKITTNHTYLTTTNYWAPSTTTQMKW